VIRVVGLDIHRVFAEAVMLDGHKIIRLGRIGMTREHLDRFARTLTHDDHVVVEATGNATAVSEVLAPHVGRVVIANPRQVRLIAEARIKTDVIDATVLAKLYAANFLPEVWVPDQRTLALRRQVTRRRQIVRQRARLKTMIQSILHAHLVPPCPHADLLGPKGRSWLLAQSLPGDEQDAVARHLREHDRLSDDLRVVERELARDALASPLACQGSSWPRSLCASRVAADYLLVCRRDELAGIPLQPAPHFAAGHRSVTFTMIAVAAANHWLSEIGRAHV